MPPFELAIFDLDGTLVDSEPIANRVFAEHLTAIGVPISFEEAERRFTGLRLPDCFEVVEREYGVAIPAGFHDRLQEETFARLRSELQPMPGAAAMLAALRMPKVVASSSEPEKIALSLEAAGLRGHFARTFSAIGMARGKPAPDLFLLAAAAMGVAPAACFVVEDSDPGVQAGLAAGMRTYALVAGDDGHAASRRAALVAAGAIPLRALQDLPAQLAV